MIVKNMESGEYYPAMMDRDLHWDIKKESLVNQDGVLVKAVYDFGKVGPDQIDPLWAAFRNGMEEGQRSGRVLPYVVLQKDKTRYTFRYDKALEKYNEEREMLLLTGGTSSSQKISVEDALEKIRELKEEGYFVFRNAKEVSWYATVENNTPYMERWEEKDGFLLPIDSHSAGVAKINGYECEVIDEWYSDEHSYILGKDKGSEEFYYVKVDSLNDIEKMEFDHKPDREEVEAAFLDWEADRAIDEYEAEYGADGRRAFPSLNDVSKTLDVHVEKMSLRDFLNCFAFDYQVVMPDTPREKEHREKLLKDFAITEDDLGVAMLGLKDLQGGNFGNIEGDRFVIQEDTLARALIQRLEIYIHDVISDFEDAIEDMGVAAEGMNLEELVHEAKELGIEDGVNYDVAAHILNPELIDVSPVLEEVRRCFKKEIIEKDCLDQKVALAAERINGISERVIEKSCENER